MEYFTTLEEIITTQKPAQKIEKFNRFYQEFLANSINFDHKYQPKIFDQPSYHSICNIVPAQEVPKREALHTNRGKAILFHSIAHIEYSAIDLALDASYRFTHMPHSFYEDWLEVANDEIRHFLMLEKLLQQVGFRYGDFNVHAFLFDISQRSVDLVTRMAVVPRYLEASGLDSNPKIIQKLQNVDDSISQDALKVLKIILDEEIEHVKKGDYWFKYACKLEKISTDRYFDIVEKILPGAKKKKLFINIDARREAGFSCDEIKVISDETCQ
jgi:uncharacterized ferritin-like protein (DUF455 family)